MAMGNWWIVMLPGEDASLSEMYGPFRSEDTAQAVADKWNRDASPGDQAQIMPILPAREIANATRL
ncbi:hypothetical protein [Nonomuraea typhae]|uniref:hypothetical protein n=1 Tax=Nonomuraea typhae TaxID=2603600 RepID=UPI0012F94EB3|nr:hypothetical protein [Nonomuraea typhae]